MLLAVLNSLRNKDTPILVASKTGTSIRLFPSEASPALK